MYTGACLFYLALTIVGYMVGKVGEERVGSIQKNSRRLMIVAGFLYSLYLVNYQFNSIGELCALCLTSAGIAALMFITLMVDRSGYEAV